MTAIAYRHPGIIHRLIRAGAFLDAQDSDGQTALMRAAHYRNPEAAKILLDAGATATIRDKYGMTALARVPDGDGAPVRELRVLLQRAESGTK
jgi:ankyrin repeat protein